MKKSLMLSLALLTIGSALHAGKGFGTGFGTGVATGLVAGSVFNRRDRDVVYVRDSQSSSDLKDQIKELEEEIRKLKRELRRKEGKHRRSY